MTVTDITTPPLYELRGVGKSYGQGATQVRAVRDLSLTIESGDFVTVAGPSGSGKTTLLQLLGALDRPTEGAILFEGSDLATLKEAELTALRLATIGFVFQQFNLIPTLSAAENVALALAPRGVRARDRRERVEALLQAVGLGSRGHHLPRSSPAASNSVSPSPGRSGTSRGSCSPTSRPETSTRRPARRSSGCCARSARIAGRPSS